MKQKAVETRQGAAATRQKTVVTRQEAAATKQEADKHREVIIMELKGLAHIAIYTTDVEQSIAWYQKLGGECYDRGEVKKPTGINRLAMVRLAGLDLELIQPGDGTPVEPAGGVIPHLALEVADLDAAISQLRAVGIDSFRTEQPVELPDLFGGLRNIFLTGPSGELIELLQHL